VKPKTEDCLGKKKEWGRIIRGGFPTKKGGGDQLTLTSNPLLEKGDHTRGSEKKGEF